jgi:hypothetical protein
MSDARSLEALQRIARREVPSLMQYLAGAYPWTQGQSAALDRLQNIIETEREALARLTRYLYRHRMPPPHTGGYPIDFTSLNFVDLHYLVPLLIKHQEEGISRFQTDLAAVSDEEGRQLAAALLELKKRHLAELRELNSPQAAVTS